MALDRELDKRAEELPAARLGESRSHATFEDATARPLSLRWLAYAAGLTVLTIGLYANSLHAPFLFDDRVVIVADVDAHSIPAALQSQWPRRVGIFSFALNYHFHGYRVEGYHVVNLAIHIAAGLTLQGLVGRLLLTPGVPLFLTRRAIGLSAVIAGLWMAHPLQTESVTYICQRFESLAGFWILLALYALVRGGTSLRGWPWYVLCGMAGWLGYQTKEIVFGLPVLALALDRIFLASTWRDVMKRRWLPHTALVAGSGMLLFQIRYLLLATEPLSAGFTVPGLTPWAYLRSQAGVILHYLRLAFWPDVLCFDYRWPVANSAIEIYLPGAVIVTLLVITGIGLYRFPRVAFLGLAFFVILAPSSSVVPIKDLAVEHRMYLPLAAVGCLTVLALVAIADRFANHPVAVRRVLTGGFVLVLTLLGGRTFLRNGDFNQPLEIWAQAARVNPGNARAKLMLGEQFVKRGEIERGIEEYRRAIALNPDSPGPYNSIGVALVRREEWDEAARNFETALKLDPKYAEAAFNLGALWSQRSQPERAVEMYRRAVTIDPRYDEGWSGLGWAAELTGDDRLAVDCFRRALALDPSLLVIAVRLSDLLATTSDPELRDPAEALRLAESLTKRTRGRNRYVLDALSAAYAANNRFDEASAAARRALTLSGDGASKTRIQTRLASYQRQERAGRATQTEKR